MRVLVQRSGRSFVKVFENIVGQIDHGLVLLVGFNEYDNIDSINYLVNKILKLRIFPDENNIMNKSILDVNGDILSISQFTLYADTTKGNRPSYAKALCSDKAKKLYELFNQKLGEYVKVETGVFGADMDVSIENIGPTTILLER